MQAAGGAHTLRQREAALLLAVAATVLALDQLTKARAVATLEPGETVPVIDGVLHWTLQRNPGAAFGLFRQFPVVFTILASAIAAGILANLRKVTDRITAVALGLVLGGALGNLTDRIVRPPGVFRGEVVDFVDLRVWPVFNLADAAAVTGAGLLVLGSWLGERHRKEDAIREGDKNGRERDESGARDDEVAG